MGGREMQASDDPVDTVGTVIDPSGLTVLSLGSLNPGALMSKLMGASSGSGSEPRSRSRASRPTSRSGCRTAASSRRRSCCATRTWTWRSSVRRRSRRRRSSRIDLTESAKPALLDQVLVLSRLGRVGGWAAGAALHDVGAIIEKPRTFYVLAGASSGMGTPAFLTNGRIVGLLTLRQIEPGRASMASMMGGPEAWACSA